MNNENKNVNRIIAFLPTQESLRSHGAVFYDCDGVLTDNRVLLAEDGKEAVFFNRSDGLAIRVFREQGIRQAIISTETNPVVARRAEKLQIPVIHKLDSRAVDKGYVLKTYSEQNDIELDSAIFIGNDINDLPALRLVGYPCCPADAEEEVRSFVIDNIEKHGKGWISVRNGGYGVVRELMKEIVLDC